MNIIYSNARAKVQENYLLGINRLKRMIDSTPEEAIKILSEVNFGDGTLINSPLDFEKILYIEERKLLSFVRTTCADESFKRYFLLKNDYHNAETLIKSKYLKFDPEKMLACHGNFESAFMSERINTDNYKFFSKQMSDALSKCDLLFVNEKATGENISSTIKKALYSELKEIAKNINILNDIFSFSADMQNVSVCIRVRDFEMAKNFLVDAGQLTQGELRSLCTQTVEELKEKVKFYKNGSYIQKALESFSSQKPLSDFERMVDSYAIDILRKNKYATDGLTPFMLYCYYKKVEIENVRIIMVGLINGQNKNEIEGRLRDTYEG